MKSALSLALVLGATLFACGDAREDEDGGEATEALTQKACAGGACRKLAQPKALTRGRLTAVGNDLYWIAQGTAQDVDGRKIDELRHCTVPACASQSALPLVLPNGKSLRARDLRTVAGRVFFVGDEPGVANDSLFLSDGAAFAKVYAGLDTQHDMIATDDKGVVVYQDDRRTDGWARSAVRYCNVAATGLAFEQNCVSQSDSKFNYAGDVALVNGEVVVAGETTLTYVSTTDGSIVKRGTWSRSGGTRLLSTGEALFAATTVVSATNGHVTHDTGVAGVAGSSYSGDVDGVLVSNTAKDGKVYVVTRAEGDVWGIDRGGVVARLGNDGSTTVLATKQEPAGVAVAGARVYWIDQTSNADDEDPSGVIRQHAK